MTSCSRLWRSHSLRLQLLAPHNTKLFPSAKLFSASTLTTRCFFRKENGIRMDHIHFSFFKINMSVETKTLHPAFSTPWRYRCCARCNALQRCTVNAFSSISRGKGSWVSSSQLLTEWAFCRFPRGSVSIPMMFLIHLRIYIYCISNMYKYCIKIYIYILCIKYV